MLGFRDGDDPFKRALRASNEKKRADVAAALARTKSENSYYRRLIGKTQLIAGRFGAREFTIGGPLEARNYLPVVDLRDSGYLLELFRRATARRQGLVNAHFLLGANVSETLPGYRHHQIIKNGGIMIANPMPGIPLLSPNTLSDNQNRSLVLLPKGFGYHVPNMSVYTFDDTRPAVDAWMEQAEDKWHADGVFVEGGANTVAHTIPEAEILYTGMVTLATKAELILPQDFPPFETFSPE